MLLNRQQHLGIARSLRAKAPSLPKALRAKALKRASVHLALARWQEKIEVSTATWVSSSPPLQPNISPEAE
jgi:hypothetical protein